MKRLIFTTLTLILGLFIFSSSNVSKAEQKDYNAFAYINVDSGKLLKDYTRSEINDQLSSVRKRRFNGWNIYKFNTNVRATFITGALFSYRNEGTSAITYTLNIQQETTTKTSVSATDSIEIKTSGKVKSFTNSLNNTLKISGEYTTTELVKEQQNLSLTVDPKTLCVGYVEGQGYYTNGVACYYWMWLEDQIGAFEYFTITESYLKIEKLAI